MKKEIVEYDVLVESLLALQKECWNNRHKLSQDTLVMMWKINSCLYRKYGKYSIKS